MTTSPRFAPAVAIFLGLVAAFAPANLPLESPSFGLALTISAVIFGFMGFGGRRGAVLGRDPRNRGPLKPRVHLWTPLRRSRQRILGAPRPAGT